MILEKETFEKYGYKPSKLLPKSRRKVIGICDYCGNLFEKPYWRLTKCITRITKVCCFNPVCHKTKSKEAHKLKAFSQHPKIGTKFHRLTVVSKAFINPKWNRERYAAKFKCECGNIKNMDISSVKIGFVKSCGCQMTKNRRTASLLNGRYRKLYHIWCNMRRRCKKPTDRAYYLYGARGIKICSEWDNSYLIFKDWALSHNYKQHLSINRIDPHGNYCPKNCEWLTRSENSLYITEGRDKEIAKLKKRVSELESELLIYKNKIIS